MGEKVNAYINKSLSSLSMYNGLLFGLVSIWVVALVFTFIGFISFNPIAMIASTAVLVFSVGLSSWLFGALFGVRAHGVSSLITGFILALIFTPTLEPGGLLMLALVGIIAGASKYVLVYKGRHIFNPAAIAAVIIGITGLAAASWWVATPPLTIFVLAIVLISMYKTKNYAIVLTFLGVAVPTLLIYLGVNGIAFTDSLILLLSWPLLFFAGVMLTEPLTLPPRKWQMYVEAVIVGLIFAIPFQFGAFESNPAVALVVGNLFAFAFAHRQAITLKLKERRALTPTTDEFIFTPDTSARFEAGQFMELNLALKKQDLRGERRTFSVTSAPSDKHISFGIKFYEPSSAFKKEMRTLKAGAKVRVSNVSGDFILPTDATKKLLLVAGGIGVTPFISQLKTLTKNNDTRNVVLIYAVSTALEIAYKQELEASSARVIIICADKPAELPKNWQHYKASRLTDDLLKEVVNDINERFAYISGPPVFVQTTKSMVKKQGVQKVITDYFAGY